jgi:hypothetical protein
MSERQEKEGEMIMTLMNGNENDDGGSSDAQQAG